MLIDFTAIPEQVVPHMKGGEKETHVRAFSDAKCKIMRNILPPGASLGMHTHETNCEVFYILSGTGKVLYDDGCEPLGPGSCHYCPKGHTHSLINDGNTDMEFFAVIPEQ